MQALRSMVQSQVEVQQRLSDKAAEDMAQALEAQKRQQAEMLEATHSEVHRLQQTVMTMTAIQEMARSAMAKDKEKEEAVEQRMRRKQAELEAALTTILTEASGQQERHEQQLRLLADRVEAMERANTNLARRMDLKDAREEQWLALMDTQDRRTRQLEMQMVELTNIPMRIVTLEAEAEKTKQHDAQLAEVVGRLTLSEARQQTADVSLQQDMGQISTWASQVNEALQWVQQEAESLGKQLASLKASQLAAPTPRHPVRSSPAGPSVRTQPANHAQVPPVIIQPPTTTLQHHHSTTMHHHHHSTTGHQHLTSQPTHHISQLQPAVSTTAPPTVRPQLMLKMKSTSHVSRSPAVIVGGGMAEQLLPTSAPTVHIRQVAIGPVQAHAMPMPGSIG